MDKYAFSGSHFEKIQDGRHVDTCANANIGFLIAYAI